MCERNSHPKTLAFQALANLSFLFHFYFIFISFLFHSYFYTKLVGADNKLLNLLFYFRGLSADHWYSYRLFKLEN